MTSLTCVKTEKWLTYLLKVTKNDLWYSWLSVACLNEKVRSDSLIWLKFVSFKVGSQKSWFWLHKLTQGGNLSWSEILDSYAFKTDENFYE